MADDIPLGGGQPQQRTGQQLPGMMSRINQGMNNFFGPINRGIEGVTGKPDPTRTLLMALGAMRPGMGRLPMGARAPSMGAPQRMYGNDPVGGSAVNMPMDMYSSRQVGGLGNRMPNFPSPLNQPPNLPNSGNLTLQAIGQRANPMGVAQQTRMDRSRAFPFDMRQPANMSTSPTGVNAQDQFRQALIRALTEGGRL